MLILDCYCVEYKSGTDGIVKMSPRPIGIDLFAGAGGMSLGFEQAGFDVVAAVEIDPVHCATHEFNFPHCKVLPKSVVGLTGAEIRIAAGIGTRQVDVVFGGAPCQGFSMIGQRILEDPRNALVRDFLRLVAELDAKHFVFENVKGLTLGKHRQFLDELSRKRMISVMTCSSRGRFSMLRISAFRNTGNGYFCSERRRVGRHRNIQRPGRNQPTVGES